MTERQDKLVRRYWRIEDDGTFGADLTEVLERHLSEGKTIGSMMGVLMARSIGTMILLAYTYPPGPQRDKLAEGVKRAMMHTHALCIEQGEEAMRILAEISAKGREGDNADSTRH